MIYGGKQTVVKSGSPVPLAPQRTPACWIRIEALPGNNGLIHVIGCGIPDPRNPSSTTDSSGGIDIDKGGILHMGDSSAIDFYDLNLIVIDAANDGEGVKFLYGVR